MAGGEATLTSESTDLAGPLVEVSRLARESESRRQVLHSRARAAGLRAAGRIPAALTEYLKVLAASVIGYWILTALLASVSPADVLYTLPALGLLFSGQATLYKVKLAKDPAFEIPSCGCGGNRTDDTAAVLRSRESSILGVPNSVFAILLYVALIAAVAGGRTEAAIVLAVAAVVTSAYLGYMMVFRLAILCQLCVNVSALNALILAYLVL
jgi:uncharacterized membrane protein